MLACRSLRFVETALLFICGLLQLARQGVLRIEQKEGAVRSHKFSWHVTWRVSSLHKVPLEVEKNFVYSGNYDLSVYSYLYLSKSVLIGKEVRI